MWEIGYDVSFFIVQVRDELIWNVLSISLQQFEYGELLHNRYSPNTQYPSRAEEGRTDEGF